MGFFKWLFGSNEIVDSQNQQTENTDFIQKYEEKEKKAQNAASINGSHYTDSVETIKQLKRENRLDEAIDLALKAVAATEKEAQIQKWGVAPWYYNQMAIIYRKQKKYDSEIEILERLIENRDKWIDPETLEILKIRDQGKDRNAATFERINKAKALLEKSQR